MSTAMYPGPVGASLLRGLGDGHSCVCWYLSIYISSWRPGSASEESSHLGLCIMRKNCIESHRCLCHFHATRGTKRAVLSVIQTCFGGPWHPRMHNACLTKGGISTAGARQHHEGRARDGRNSGSPKAGNSLILGPRTPIPR